MSATAEDHRRNRLKDNIAYYTIKTIAAAERHDVDMVDAYNQLVRLNKERLAKDRATAANTKDAGE